MKRASFFLAFCLCFAIATTITSCGHSKQKESVSNSETQADSLLIHALQSIFNPSLSCLDATDEIMMLLDTMQSHVESCPDEQIRIGAKSLALEIGSMFLYNDSITPEEEKFFEDSLLFPLIDIQSTWYCPPYVPNNMTDWAAQPVLLQEIVFRYDYSNDIHVIKLAIYYHPEKSDILSIEMPVEAEYLMSIGFMNDSTRMVDTSTVFTLADSFESIPRTEESGAMLFYNQNLIYEMLTHNDMLIMFIGTEEAENLEDRFHYVHLSLNKFHEQFYSVLQMLESQKSVMNVISNTQYDEDGNHSAWAGRDWFVFSRKGDKMFASGTLITPMGYDSIYTTIKAEFGEPTYSTRDFVLDPELAESDTDMFDLARWENMRDINYWCNDSLVICCSFMFLDSMEDGGYYSYLTIDQLNVKQPETHVCDIIRNVRYSGTHAISEWADRQWEVFGSDANPEFRALTHRISLYTFDSIRALLCFEYGAPTYNEYTFPRELVPQSDTGTFWMARDGYTQFYYWCNDTIVVGWKLTGTDSNFFSDAWLSVKHLDSKGTQQM